MTKDEKRRLFCERLHSLMEDEVAAAIKSEDDDHAFWVVTEIAGVLGQAIVTASERDEEFVNDATYAAAMIVNDEIEVGFGLPRSSLLNPVKLERLQ